VRATAVVVERKERAVEVEGLFVLDATDCQQPAISKVGCVGATDVQRLNALPTGTTAPA